MELISRDQAIQIGLKRYCTGKPCKHGHVAERWTSTYICCACDPVYSKKYKERSAPRRREYAKKYHIENRDTILARGKKWQAEHPDRVKELNKKHYWGNVEESRAAATAWRKANPEKKAEANRKWAAANPDKVRESGRRNYQKNLDAQRARSRQKHIDRQEQERAYKKAYREKFPEKHRAHEARRRARKMSLPGEFSSDDVAHILKLQRRRCAYCRTKLKLHGYHIDHIAPLSKGGSNDRRNLQVTCSGCNLSKGPKDPVEFARITGRLI